MAVTTPVKYNGMYLGSMSVQNAEVLLQIRESKAIEPLRHMIFDFPPDMIMRQVDECKRLRDIVKEENLDYKQYIGSLRDYQTVGTAFMYYSPRSMLADGVGLGKTVEVACLINYLKSRGEITRFMIAVENSALSQTAYELIRFTGLNVVALPSDAQHLKRTINKLDWTKVDGLVIKHSALRSDFLSRWIALNLDERGMCKIFNTFFLDESSVIKNATTKTYKYTKNICDICERVHFMNATAFELYLMDVYNQMDMMNQVLLPKKWRIEKDFCTFGRSSYWTKVNGKAKMNFRRDLTGYKNQSIFKESLKLFYFGRCKQDIGMDMPHIHKVYEVEPSGNQLIAIANGQRYNEILNCPSLVPEAGLHTDTKDCPKLARLVDIVNNEFNGQKVMVYCFHIEAQEAIAREMINIGRKPMILNGETPDDERYKMQMSFNKGDCDVIITNIKKSLNLYGGDACIFYSVLTNPSSLFQAAGRIDRNVDDKIKTYILLLYKGTDEYDNFVNVVRQRAKDSRDLTLDAKTTVDYFIESMQESE